MSCELLLENCPNELREISTKVLNHERLSRSDGLQLLQTNELQWLQQLADYTRKRMSGEAVLFSNTLFIHPTNLCELSCPLCSFYAKPGWEKAWFLTPAQIEEKVREHEGKNIIEVHVVGGLWRECDLDYYKELFTRIKNYNPALHIKALTPVEYHFLADLHGISIEEVFQKMISWGLGSLPGGGAEILVEEIRKKIAPGKITSDQYLEVHKKAHRLGLNSNITMLFGHIEENRDIIEHLIRIREVQDETKGFQTFVPLKYHDENNALGKAKSRLKPKDIRRVYAISRLLLDNIPNIKVLWNYIGFEEALTILNFGANDLGSTSLEEKIITMAGGVQLKMTQDVLASAITQLGRIPQLIHSGRHT